MVSNIEIFPAFGFLLEPAPFKGLYGGRGGGKSFQAIDALLIDSFKARHRIAVLRELQNSIKESVHSLIASRVETHGMQEYFTIAEHSIKNRVTGSDFFFKGLKNNIAEIKGTFGITRAFVEEAEPVSDRSWEMLFPTVRTAGGEIWAIWNPENENNATDRLWIKNPDPDMVVRQVSWRDNPYFPANLERQRLSMLARDPVLYEHIWEGGYRKISEAVIFKNRIEVHEFDTPFGVEFKFGGDFGFSEDPSTLIRSYITQDGEDFELWIDQEAYGKGIELDDMAAFYDTVPESRRWPIYADCSRPETIAFLKRKGFDIYPADKWPGSVEDGITYMQGFKKIHVHERCTNTAREFRTYSFKTDKAGNILRIPLDKDNHCIDAERYGLNGYIKKAPSSIFDMDFNNNGMV